MSMNAATRSLIEPIVDSLSTALVVLNADLRVQYLNSAAEQLLGVSSSQAESAPLERLLTLSNGLTERLLQTAAGGNAYTEFEYRWTDSQQKKHVADLAASPLIDVGQEHDLLLEILPLDRHLRLNEEWQSQIQHDANREVVRGLAHEIKNPLGGLRGAAQLLQGELPNNIAGQELREYTDVIIKEADRLQALVDRVLGPNRPPKKHPMNIHEALEHVHRLIQAEHNQLTIVCDYDPSLPDIAADREQIVQALLNLGGNAAQAMDGTGCLTLRSRSARQITIAGYPHRLAVVVEIADNGPGIPEELRDRIFFPMVTGRADGTGLGLPIAQSLIQQHKGSLICESEPGNTIFRVTLPVDQL